MLTCRDATVLASRALDQPLPWTRRLSLRIHLVLCRYCQRYQQQLRFLRLAARSIDDGEAVSNPLPGDAKERLRKCLHESRSRG